MRTSEGTRDQTVGRDTPNWRGSAKLVSNAKIVASKYPVLGKSVDDETGIRVDFAIQAPQEETQPMKGVHNIHSIDLRILTEDSWPAEAAARESVASIADSLSFASGRRVTFELGAMTRFLGKTPATPYQTILPLSHGAWVEEARGIPIPFLLRLYEGIGDTKTSKGRKLTRSIRWLRRSYVASDEVEEFSCLAFALEAAADLLPSPSVRGKKKGKPTKADRMRHLALRTQDIGEKKWQDCGRLRHELFHGGLKESSATRTELGKSIPDLRIVAVAALKTVLSLGNDQLPMLERPPVTIGGAQVVAPFGPPDMDHEVFEDWPEEER